MAQFNQPLADIYDELQTSDPFAPGSQGLTLIQELISDSDDILEELEPLIEQDEEEDYVVPEFNELSESEQEKIIGIIEAVQDLKNYLATEVIQVTSFDQVSGLEGLFNYQLAKFSQLMITAKNAKDFQITVGIFNEAEDPVADIFDPLTRDWEIVVDPVSSFFNDLKTIIANSNNDEELINALLDIPDQEVDDALDSISIINSIVEDTIAAINNANSTIEDIIPAYQFASLYASQDSSILEVFEKTTSEDFRNLLQAVRDQ